MAISYFTFDESLDIGRYYEFAEKGYKYYENYSEYLISTFLMNNDFIYTSLLYQCYSNDIDPNVLTTFIVFLYYVLLLTISFTTNEYSYSTRINRGLLFVVFFIVPLVILIAVARTACSSLFFMLAAISFLKHSERLGHFFLVCTVLTHFGMLIAVLCLYAGKYLAYKNKYSSKVIFIILAAVLGGVILPTLFNGIFKFASSMAGESRYAAYSSMGDEPLLLSGAIDKGTKLIYLYLYVLSIFCAIVDKNRNFMYWTMVCFTILYCFFFLSSAQMMYRLSLMSSCFVGYSIISIYSREPKRIKPLIAVSILVTVFYFYTNRMNFSF